MRYSNGKKNQSKELNLISLLKAPSQMIHTRNERDNCNWSSGKNVHLFLFLSVGEY